MAAPQEKERSLPHSEVIDFIRKHEDDDEIANLSELGSIYDGLFGRIKWTEPDEKGEKHVRFYILSPIREDLLNHHDKPDNNPSRLRKAA